MENDDEQKLAKKQTAWARTARFSSKLPEQEQQQQQQKQPDLAELLDGLASQLHTSEKQLRESEAENTMLKEKLAKMQHEQVAEDVLRANLRSCVSSMGFRAELQSIEVTWKDVNGAPTESAKIPLTAEAWSEELKAVVEKQNEDIYRAWMLDKAKTALSL